MSRHLWIVSLAALAACSDGSPPARIARVDVVSPVDSIIAQGSSHQFTATARDAAGQQINAVFSWLSTNPAAAGVGNAGLVSALAPGNATIQVAVPADPAAGGALGIRVVNADLPAVATINADAFGNALVAALSGGAQPAAQASWSLCGTHAADGNIVAIRRCVLELRTQAGAVTDLNDRVLLSVLAIYGDHIERRLAL